MPHSSRRKAFAGSNLSTDPKCPKCIYKISKNFRVEILVKYSPCGECEIIHFVNCEISHTACGSVRCEMKFAHIREANISHLRSKYFTAKLFHLPKGQISLKKARLRVLFSGRGSWIRTNECRSQSPVPYRLAIPQYSLHC